jgi:galactitol-specific phosphotransferase system IIB component
MIVYQNRWLNQHLYHLGTWCKEHNININIEKTEVMIAANQEVKARVVVEKTDLKQTIEFKYFASVFE